MRSRECQAYSLLPWWIFLSLPFIAIAAKKHYALDYGDGLGNATIELDEDTHTAFIYPPQATTPSTLINFRRSLVVYVSHNGCKVAKLEAGERKYKEYVGHAVIHTQKHPTLYVMGSIPPHKVRKHIGEELFMWCQDKPTMRLSTKPPKLPATKVSLKNHDSTTSEATPQLHTEMHQDTDATEHQRYKRRAKKEKKSKDRKGKSRGGRRGRGKKKNKKDKKNKRPKTKSLKNKSQKLNIIAPRIEFPPALISQRLTDAAANPHTPEDHVVLQEEPYPSPSFIRNGEDGQRFRHYQHFYQESNGNDNDTHVPDRVNRIISHDTRSGTGEQSRISIPETIVKDGQIFYRYDAEENTSGDKGQSKRSHAGDQDFMDDDAQSGRVFEDYNESRISPNEFSLPADNQVKHTTLQDSNPRYEHNNMNSQPALSYMQTQAQMGDGKHGASAIALSGNGPATQVHGSSGSDGFFIAQAHSIDHQGGTSLAHVFGNKHGVQGSATTRGHGHHSHVQVDMGAHPSSKGHISSHEGSSLLSSSVQATQLGGSAGAQAYGDGPSASNAQMEFNPRHQYHGGGNGLRGQGSATATVTKTGGALLTSLTGEVSGGSYLGTAHSSIGHDLGLSPGDENNTYSTHGDFSQPNEITQEFGNPDPNPESLTHHSQFQEDLSDKRPAYEETHHGNELFKEQNSGLQDDTLHTDYHSGHSSGDMIGNIMETVHQPNMQPEIIAYPARQYNIIDEDGLTVGAGIPPRESEIEQTPLGALGEFQEGIGRSSGGSKAGIVGLATYSHGRLGAPPGPGELLNTPHQQDSAQYDYKYYDDRYNSAYYDDEYSDLGSQNHSDLPYFDLGPKIVDFEPLESNYENFQPVHLPGQQATETPQSYDELDSLEVTPDPPIVVHQVQAPTLDPDDTSVNETLYLHDPPQNYSSSDAAPAIEEFPAIDFSTVPPYSVKETPQMGHVFLAPTTTPSQQQSTPSTYVPSIYSDVLPEHRPFSTNQAQGRTYSQPAHQESFESWSHSQPRTQQFPQPGYTSVGKVQSEITRENNMETVPLHPGVPGSRRTLPGNQGGPNVTIMTYSASEVSADHSLLRQRPGTSLQPGEKIPGAPGYRVPPGFRGHVILGHNLPISATSRKVVQGFNTHVQLSPQSPASNSPVYASVSGPGASQQLASRETPTGVHITLSGGGGHNQSAQPSHSSLTMVQSADDQSSSARGMNGRTMVSSQQAFTHSSMHTRPQSASSSGSSWKSRGNVTPQKSWDGQRQGTRTPQKSWDGQQHGTRNPQKSWNGQQRGTGGNQMSWNNQDSENCGYYSMNCEIVYGPYERSRICEPVLITIDCCC